MTNNMGSFTKLREALALQLSSSRYKKSDLVSAYYFLTKSQINCKKAELADIVSAIISQEIQNRQKTLIIDGENSFQIRRELGLMLQDKLKALNLSGLSISKKIQDIFNSETSNNMASHRQVRVNQETVQNIWNSSSEVIQCLCPKPPSNLQETKKMETCYRCNQKYHSQCFWPPEKGELFQCPFCYLKNCLPHKQVKQILFGGFLPILKKEKVEYKINFSYDLKSKSDKSLYLEARCVKFNKQNKYEISWIDNGSVSLNKIKFSDFKPLLTNSPLKRRSDEPLKLDKMRLQQQNEIIIEERNTSENGFKLNKKCYHLVAIMVISEISNELVQTKFEKNIISINQSKQALRQYMAHQSGDITIQKISVSLKCQYYSSRIKLPARSRLCNTHMQPFDLMNFINSSVYSKSATRKWKCPICDKRAYDLVIDKYILDLMNLHPQANEIIFKQNGQPQMIQGNDDSNQEQDSKQIFRQSKKQNEKKVQMVIDLDQQIQEFIDSQRLLAQRALEKNKTQQKKSEQVVIDEKKSLINQKDGKLINQQISVQLDQKTKQRTFADNQGDTLKKKRKLNDGSIEVIEKQKKIQKIIQKNNLVELSSDQQVYNVDKITLTPFKKNQINKKQKINTATIQKKSITITNLQPFSKKNDKGIKQKFLDKSYDKPISSSSESFFKNTNSSKVLSNESLSKIFNPIKNTGKEKVITIGNIEKPVSKRIQEKDISIIQIDSDNQQQIVRSEKQIQKELLQKLSKQQKSLQGKVEISQEQTEAFETLYTKIMSMSSLD